MKLIVLCLSLFLGCQLTYAQKKSQKQERYDQLVQQLQVIDNLIMQYKNQPNLSKKDSANLESYKKTRASRWEEMKKIERQIQSEEELKRLIQEGLQKTPEELKKEKEWIYELTRRYWAKKLTWHDYVDQIFGNRSQISFNGKKYAVGLWEKEVLEGYQAIEYYKYEIDQIIKNLPIQVQELTGGIYTPNINQNNLKKHPHDPYYFSKVVNERVKAISSPLSEQTKQKIQQTFNNAVNKSEELKSKQEKAKKEYDELQNGYNLICAQCPQCCQQ